MSVKVLCRECNQWKDEEEFFKGDWYVPTRKGRCKQCKVNRRLEWSRTIDGLLWCTYNRQKHSQADREHGNIGYTFDELYDWITQHFAFDDLYSNWRKSDYARDLRPSVDRLDNNFGYSLDNIRLCTWRENYLSDSKANLAIAHSKIRRKVAQLDLDGNVIAEFESIQEAGRKTSANADVINRVCKGLSGHSGGFKWKYI